MTPIFSTPFIICICVGMVLCRFAFDWIRRPKNREIVHKHLSRIHWPDSFCCGGLLLVFLVFIAGCGNSCARYVVFIPHSGNYDTNSVTYTPNGVEFTDADTGERMVSSTFSVRDRGVQKGCTP
jgi:hypothetical protein